MFTSKKIEQKLTAIPLGYVDHALGIYNPWPDLIVDGSKDPDGELPLGVIQADAAIANNRNAATAERLKHLPLHVLSRRSADEVEGIAYRGMPVLSMLPYFKESLHNRHRYDPATGEPNPDHRMVEFYEGAAGAGKTEMAKTIARMRDPRGPIVFDCGGKNLDDILFQTVLDQDKSRSLMHAMDEAIEAHNNGERPFNASNIAVLREAMGDAMIEVEGQLLIDWDWFGKNKPAEESGSERPKKPDPQRSINVELFEKQKTALQRFMEIENIKLDHRAGFGLKRVYGPLIEAVIQDRELVLDEYTKGIPGTGMQLQIIWELLNGDPNKRTHKVYGGQGLEFEFDRSNIGEMFHVTLTGNDKSDGQGTFKLDTSTRDRLAPAKIFPFTKRDYAHRIAQTLCGLPLTTLKAMEPLAEQHPEAFHEELMRRRNQGLPADQQISATSPQGRMIHNWQDTITACNQLALLFHAIDEIKSTQSAFYKSGTQSAIRSEIQNGRSIDFSVRRFSQLLTASYKPSSTSLPASQSIGFLGKKVEKSGTSQTGRPVFSQANRPVFNFSGVDHLPWFGERLQEVLKNEIYRMTEDKPETRKYLEEVAKKAGILENILTQGQAANGGIPIKDLLKLGAPDVELDDVARTQSILCDYLRARDPHVEGSNEDLLPRRAVEAAMQTQKAHRATVAAAASSGEHMLIVPNEPDKMISSAGPLGVVIAAEPADLYSSIPNSRGPKAHLPILGIIASLALPDGIGKENLGHLFSKTFTDSEKNKPPKSLVPSNAADKAPYDFLESSHPSGIAFTTLRGRRADDEVDTLHLIKNDKGQALLVGDRIEPKWSERLREQGVFYIDRSHEKAGMELSEAFNIVLGSHVTDETIINDLVWAFQIRNGVNPNAIAENATYSKNDLERLLLEPDLSLPDKAVRVTLFASLTAWRDAIAASRQAAQTEQGK
ncbi:MAG: hypothetical protein K2Q12_05400 [Rickettsiales bacterium]|nr:hypothetical protein [Rickettsiales bacterium]